jgi:hypothetical protein
MAAAVMTGYAEKGVHNWVFGSFPSFLNQWEANHEISIAHLPDFSGEPVLVLNCMLESNAGFCRCPDKLD